MLAVLLVVLGVGYALYRVVTRGGLSSRDPALRELRVAYAQGELSEDEFKQRKDVLEEANQ
ncbi:SHOCT domain-containing protein [Halopenitus salinus]|uniref:SHOCT domain-containing protein n=1 Tax=Halopenitus salinus TaxID=1198295 RepID=A0ABD5UX61_9EURY